jgi:hypothetical protein
VYRERVNNTYSNSPRRAWSLAHGALDEDDRVVRYGRETVQEGAGLWRVSIGDELGGSGGVFDIEEGERAGYFAIIRG